MDLVETTPVRSGISVLADPTFISPTEEGLFSPGRLLSILWRNKSLVLLVALAVFVPVSSFILFKLPDRYTASALVLIEATHSIGTDSNADDTKTPTDLVAIRTQIDLMKSRSIALSVVRQLDLVHQKEFSNVIFKRPGMVSSVVNEIRDALDLPRRFDADAEGQESLATELLIDKLTFVNDGRSFVVSVNATTTDANLSAALANSYANAYVNFTRKVKTDAIQQANSWFNDRLVVLAANVAKANKGVQDFRAANGLVEDRAGSTAAGNVTVAGQQMSQINTQLAAATAIRAQKEASLAQVRAAQKAGVSLDNIPEVVASPLITTLHAQLADIGGRYASLASTRSDLDPGLQSLRKQRDDMQAHINIEVRNIVDSIAADARSARARETYLQAQLDGLKSNVTAEGQTEVKLAQLQNEASAAQSIYVSYLNWFEKTSNEVGLQQPDAQLTAPSAVPIATAPPSKKQLVALTGLISVILGVAVAFLRDRSSPGFRTSSQLVMSTGLLCLGSIPTRSRWLRSTKERRTFRDSVALVRNMLDRGRSSSAPKVVLVTSALPGEGKTFTAVTLAREAAAAGRRTLLIDCDQRRPALAKMFGISNAPVLNSILEPGAAEQNCYRDPKIPLSVVVIASEGDRQKDVLSSPAMREMLQEARNAFDLVILDSPPVLLFADACVLASIADATLLVVRWVKSPKQVVREALEMLRLYGAKLEGTVLNGVSLEKLSRSEDTRSFAYRRYRTAHR